MTRPQDKHWLDKAIKNTAPGFTPEPDFKTWQQQHPQALVSLQQRAQKSTRSRTDLSTVIELGRRIMRSPITKLAIAAVFIVGCLFLARHLKGSDTLPTRQPTIVEKIEPTPLIENQSDKILGNELALVQNLYEQKDLPGLLMLLGTGQEPTQLKIAEFLAEIGDASAIPVLQRLADTLDDAELQTAIQASILTIQTRLKRTRPVDVNGLQSSGSNVQTDQEVSIPGEGMFLTLLDAETDQPVQGVSVKVSYRYGQTQNRQETLTTDDGGQCRITWDGDDPDSLNVRVIGPGYVCKMLEWNPDKSGISMPASYTSYLHRGVTIGGVVKTEAGEPIEDVVVSVGSAITGGQQIERDTTFSSQRQVRTDAQGQWIYEHFPVDGDAFITVEHPSYVSTKRTVWNPSMEALQNRSSIVLMRPGLTLIGRVVDTLGLPVEGVEVMEGNYGSWDYWIDTDKKTMTDAEGWFRFDRRVPGPTILTVVGPGYAQDMQEIPVTEGMSDIEFVLQPANLLMLQVNDPHGKAIQGCSVMAWTWRRIEYANQSGHSIRGKALTDETGRAVLYDLPLDEVLYHIQADGFVPLDDYALIASDQVQTVTLYAQGKLKGRVLDAATGEVIPRFTITDGIQWKPDTEVVWQEQDAKQVANGRYEVAFRYQNRGTALRFEAEGYLPTETEVHFNDGTEIIRDITLTPGIGLSGYVINSDGTPAPDAKMLIATARWGNVIRDGVIEDTGESWRMISADQNGHFSFPPPKEAFKVVAVGELGMAEVSEDQFLSDSKIQLEVWGQVEGQVSTGDQPAANQEISLRRSSDFKSLEGVRVAYPNRMHADAQGRFRFTKVKPGTVTVQSQGRTMTIEVNAGETAQVRLGGGGRHVMANLVLPEASHGLDFLKCFVSIQSAQEIPAEVPQVSLPEDYLFMDMAQQAQWRQDWSESVEGQVYRQLILENQRQSERVNCSINLKTTGELLIEDILPGHYELDGRFENPDRAFWGERDLVTRFKYAFSIPDAGDNDYYTVPVDLGVIPVPVTLPVQLGRAAPEFSMKGLDGRSFYLSDFHGQFLLLDVLAEGYVSDQDVRRLEILKELQAAHGTSGELAILTVAPSDWIDTNILHPLKHLMTREELHWTFGVLERSQEEAFSSGYYHWGHKDNESRYHSPLLIVPNGTVLDLDIPLDRLLQTVQQALHQ